MIFFILKCLWFIFPAGLANMTPVFAKGVKFLDGPVDFGKMLSGKPIFGENKTWRGFFFGSLAAILLVLIQTWLYSNVKFFQEISLVPYKDVNFILFGFLMGFGALFGDTIKSFFKRRLGYAPGAKFFPWDQWDFLFGGLIFSSFVYFPGWKVVLLLMLIIPFFHLLFNIIGYWLRLKDRWW